MVAINHYTSFVYDFVNEGMGVGLYFDGTFRKHANNNLVELIVSDVELPVTRTVCAYNKGHLPNVAKVFLEGLVANLKQSQE